MTEQTPESDPGDRLRKTILDHLGSDRSPATKAQLGNVLVALTAMQDQIVALSSVMVEGRVGHISEDTANTFVAKANQATEAVGAAVRAMTENE